MARLPVSLGQTRFAGVGRFLTSSTPGADTYPVSETRTVAPGMGRFLSAPTPGAHSYPVSQNRSVTPSPGLFFHSPYRTAETPFNPPSCVSVLSSIGFELRTYDPATIDLSTVVVTLSYSSGGSFVVYDGSAGGFQTGVTGTVTNSNTGILEIETFSFTLNNGLPSSTTITVTISGDDSTGAAIVSTPAWSFTTCPGAVATPSTVPNDGGYIVAVTGALRFSDGQYFVHAGPLGSSSDPRGFGGGDVAATCSAITASSDGLATVTAASGTFAASHEGRVLTVLDASNRPNRSPSTILSVLSSSQAVVSNPLAVTESGSLHLRVDLGTPHPQVTVRSGNFVFWTPILPVGGPYGITLVDVHTGVEMTTGSVLTAMPHEFRSRLMSTRQRLSSRWALRYRHAEHENFPQS